MSGIPGEGVQEVTGNNLPDVQRTLHLPTSVLFGAIGEAPREEQKNLYRQARDTVYLGFADNVLAMSDDVSVEERVAALEFTGSALDAFLPESMHNRYYFGTKPSEVTHTLNIAQLSIRLEQIRARGYKLANERPRSKFESNHLDEAFPTNHHLPTDNYPWQWKSGETHRAKRTCLFIIDPVSLVGNNKNSYLDHIPLAEKTAGNYLESDLLRAADIYVEATIFQLSNKRTAFGDVNTEIKALTALRTPDLGRQLTDVSLLAELNKLEVLLRATAILRIDGTKHGEPDDLVNYGEFVFDPSNCDETGFPNGLTTEEAIKVREQHIKNVEFMSKFARKQNGEDVRPTYAALLTKYQSQLEIPQ